PGNALSDGGSDKLLHAREPLLRRCITSLCQEVILDQDLGHESRSSTDGTGRKLPRRRRSCGVARAGTPAALYTPTRFWPEPAVGFLNAELLPRVAAVRRGPFAALIGNQHGDNEYQAHHHQQPLPVSSPVLRHRLLPRADRHDASSLLAPQ